MGAGYWNWNLGECLLREFPRDSLTVQDFARGYADKYRIILDSNTSIMSDDLLVQIEKWVRAGGTFVTHACRNRPAHAEPSPTPGRSAA